MHGQLTCTIVYYNGTCLKRPPLGPKLLTALDRWSYYAGSTECKRSFRTTGGGHNREVVALYRWPLEQVPLYSSKDSAPLIFQLLFGKTQT